MTAVAGHYDADIHAIKSHTIYLEDQTEIVIEELLEDSDTSDYLSDDPNESSSSDSSSGYEDIKDCIEDSKEILNEPRTTTLPNPYIKVERCDHLLSLSPGPNFYGIYKVKSERPLPLRTRRPSSLYHSNDFAVYGLDKLYEKAPRAISRSKSKLRFKKPKTQSKGDLTRSVYLNHHKIARSGSLKSKNNFYISYNSNLEQIYEIGIESDDCFSNSSATDHQNMSEYRSELSKVDDCTLPHNQKARRRKQILNPRNYESPMLMSHGKNKLKPLHFSSDVKAKTKIEKDRLRQTLCRVKEEIFDYSGDEQTQCNLNTPYILDNLNSSSKGKQFRFLHGKEVNQEVNSSSMDGSYVGVGGPQCLKKRKTCDGLYELDHQSTSFVSCHARELKKEPESAPEDDSSDVDVENDCPIPRLITDQQIVYHDHTYSIVSPETILFHRLNNGVHTYSTDNGNENLRVDTCNTEKVAENYRPDTCSTGKVTKNNRVAKLKKVRDKPSSKIPNKEPDSRPVRGDQHNKLERIRRAELKSLFDGLWWSFEDESTTTCKISILKGAVKEIARLESESKELQQHIRYLKALEKRLADRFKRLFMAV